MGSAPITILPPSGRGVALLFPSKLCFRRENSIYRVPVAKSSLKEDSSKTNENKLYLPRSNCFTVGGYLFAHILFLINCWSSGVASVVLPTVVQYPLSISFFLFLAAHCFKGDNALLRGHHLTKISFFFGGVVFFYFLKMCCGSHHLAIPRVIL